MAAYQASKRPSYIQEQNRISLLKQARGKAKSISDGLEAFSDELEIDVTPAQEALKRYASRSAPAGIPEPDDIGQALKKDKACKTLFIPPGSKDVGPVGYGRRLSTPRISVQSSFQEAESSTTLVIYCTANYCIVNQFTNSRILITTDKETNLSDLVAGEKFSSKFFKAFRV